VLADFGELGEEANSIHQNMGQQAKAAGVKRLFTLGEMTTLTSETFGEGAMHFNDMTQLASVLKTELNPNVTCLFKGSRYMQLDRLVDQLVTEGEH
jgi:UDP-N-acetylmuramoyl-tripeptide--D-alanyl-D-alanine ligase